ncbi:MAG: sensor histidine kinase [Bacteroides sp.]|nr:sensor histidine kinase [Bacteroides sp.]
MRTRVIFFIVATFCSFTLMAQSSASFIKKAQQQHGRNEYKEAFESLRNAESALYGEERAGGKKMPEVRYNITKERIQMYIKLRNSKRAKEQLERLEEQTKTIENDSIANDLLYTQANVYYTFGESTKGDACINKLIEKYKAAKQYDEIDYCYQTIIGIARRASNASFMARTYEKYMLWNDSVQALKAQDNLDALQQKYDESLQTITEKDDKLSSKQYIIIALCVLLLILAAALVVGALVLLRFIVLSRKQKKIIQTAKEHNELKTKFIQNISSQMGPTLNNLPQHLAEVKALHAFADHIQEMSELESTIDEPFEMENKNILTFCESVMAKIVDKTQSNVTCTVNAPKLSAPINVEHLERVILHLLENAAKYTPEGGKIILDFKKRGAHTHQFIVTDTGCGIAEEQRENLFKPFAQVKELTQGDGLGLPICALIATKMNGSLSLDSSYTKGTRFVLELHV